MSSANDRLSEVFERACHSGIGVLTADERELYEIQEFILHYELGGVSGYLYNHLVGTDKIRAVISAMRKRKLTRLAALLEEAVELVANYNIQDSPTTWGRILQECDPNRRLASIDTEIEKLDDYGLDFAEIP